MVLDILRFSLHDGPGIRTTVFLKGCPLKCLWCHNPESISPSPEIGYFSNRCIHCGACSEVCPTNAQSMENGLHVYNRELCMNCYKCVDACSFDSLRIYGHEMSVQEVLEEVEKDKNYYIESGGGITVSGGEPLFQPQFTMEILKGAKVCGIHTCIETSGFASISVLKKVLPFTDYFLFDYKASEDRHQSLTGVKYGTILQNLEYLMSKDVSIELRCPLIPGINDSPKYLLGIAELTSKFGKSLPIRIMPYHNTGNGKLERFGYIKQMKDIENLSEKQVQKWLYELKNLGVNVLI